MAKATDQNFNIRHRLVGAVVLLGLGVVFIPMFLQGKGPGGVMKTDNLTEEVQEWIVGTEKAQTYTSRVQPVGEDGVQRDAESIALDADAPPELVVIDDPEVQPLQADEPAPQAQAVEQPPQDNVQEQTEQQPEQAQIEPLEEPQQQADEPATPEPTQTASLKSEDVSRGWMVQVGTFSKPENAQNLISKLDESGFDPRYEVVDTDSGQATRVWVGPYEKRVTAGRALETVKEKTGVKGFIKSYP